MENKKRKFLNIIIGAVIGLITGFFGGGGGMIAVPMLEKFNKLPVKKAHATAILIILPTTISSSIIYIVRGSVKLVPLLTSGVGIIIGGIIGAYLLKKLSGKIIEIVFSLLMIIAGITMIF